MAMHDRVERGETAGQARESARREFGNVGLVKEVTSEMWGWASLERLIQDLRYGLRMLRMNKAFTVVAVLSLALGIGANTAIFSMINALMLRMLPVKEPLELVLFSVVGAQGPPSYYLNYPLYEMFRDRNRSFAPVGCVAAGVITTD